MALHFVGQPIMDIMSALNMGTKMTIPGTRGLLEMHIMALNSGYYFMPLQMDAHMMVFYPYILQGYCGKPVEHILRYMDVGIAIPENSSGAIN